MAAVGGSIQSVIFRGRLFSVAADAESQRKFGGFENEVMANGDGSGRLIKTRVPLSIDGLTLNIDDDNADHEFLQDSSDMNSFGTLLIIYASGSSYQGNAQIVGEMQFSSQNSTAAVSFMGPGKLTKQ